MADQQLFSVLVTAREDPREVFRVDRTFEPEHWGEGANPASGRFTPTCVAALS